jgi:hypothetical protein
MSQDRSRGRRGVAVCEPVQHLSEADRARIVGVEADGGALSSSSTERAPSARKQSRAASTPRKVEQKRTANGNRATRLRPPNRPFVFPTLRRRLRPRSSRETVDKRQHRRSREACNPPLGGSCRRFSLRRRSRLCRASHDPLRFGVSLERGSHLPYVCTRPHRSDHSERGSDRASLWRCEYD